MSCPETQATARRCSVTIITPGPYYTWAFIGFAVAVAAIAVMLLFDSQFRDDGKPQPVGALAGTAVGLVIALTALNVISTLLECGFAACPDNPAAYELLKRAP
jgi:hypothetical protein